MIRLLLLVLTAALLLAGCTHQAPAADRLAAAQTPDRQVVVLEGTLTERDHQTYRELPFDVPAGAERLTIRFSYDRANRTTIDLGLFDPNGFRGWSGGNKAEFTITSSDATPSYIPGALPAGPWRLLLGVPNIRSGVTAAYRAEIAIDRATAPLPGSAFLDAPLRAAPGWYRGDFHTHTGHSDGACQSLAGRRVPCPAFLTLNAARAAGLDFVAVTDHNTASHHGALRELQAYYDTVLVIPGRELTTFFGHANMFGATAPVDFRLASADAAAARTFFSRAERTGALVSINHPAAPSGEACMGCGWVAETDPADVVAVEVANGGTIQSTGSAEAPFSHVAWWERLLDRGARATAIGGSDNHDPTRQGDGARQSPIGRPTTVVFAEALSQQAILEGVRRGRAFVDLEGVAGRRLDLLAEGPHGRARMGETLVLAPGETATLSIETEGFAGGHIVEMRNAPPLDAPLLAAAPQTNTVPIAGRKNPYWVRVNIRSVDGRLVAISNPVYVRPTKN